jgi:ferric-dicitrate binding protein FerR (iron transport regulator)
MSPRLSMTCWHTLAAALLAVVMAPSLCAQFGDIHMPWVGNTAAKATVVQGSVSLIRDSATWAVNVGDSVNVRQVIVTGPDGYASFQVADGSTFEVFPNSRITFRDNPGTWRDLVDVWLGRIRVHIQKFGGTPNPNRVHTPTAVISVRGTTFDVSVEDDDETTHVAVEEGQVAVEHRLMPRDGDPKILNAGDELVVYRNAPLTIARRADHGRVMQYIADAVWQILMRTPRLGGGTPGSVPGSVPTPTTGGGTPLPGDTSATPPPPSGGN